MLAVAACAAGCSTTTDATPYPGTCTPLTPLSWSPPGSSEGVPTDVVIRIRFDGYPDPDTLGSESLSMTTGFYWVPARFRVDLLDKTVSLRPWQQLSSNLGYTLHLQSTLHSLQGCAAESTIRSFRTGDGPSGGEPAPVVPPFTEVQALFADRCAGGCHIADDGVGCVDRPEGGLSLCATDAFDALIDVRAHTQPALPLVDPGDSARSVLLRKLIPATPGGAPPPPTLGHRDPPGMALDRAEIQMIAAWIDGGAPR
jgi:hypothetical protein